MSEYRSIKEPVIALYNSEGAMPSYEKITALGQEMLCTTRMHTYNCI